MQFHWARVVDLAEADAAAVVDIDCDSGADSGIAAAASADAAVDYDKQVAGTVPEFVHMVMVMPAETLVVDSSCLTLRY